MTEVCHRCGEDLAVGAGYCGNCGAPQMYLREYGLEDRNGGSGTTGTMPPPAPREIDWPVALSCAGVVAAGTTVLSIVGMGLPVLGLAVWVWVVSGAVLTMGMYTRRRPGARMGAGVGARVGLVVGVAMCAGLALAGAGAGLVQRFGRRDMGSFDHEMSARLHAQVAAMASTNPVPPEMLGFFYSPEFVAGMMLAGLAIVGAVVVLVSVAGGAFAGAMRARARG